jgi:hypothetical protein
MSTDPSPGREVQTLGMLIADAASLDAEQRARLLALEDGRHPALNAIRAALGSGLEADTAVVTGRIALGPDRGHPHLIEAIDAAYRALASPRIVRAVITDERISSSRDGDAIRVRDGDPLVLLVLADNRTAASVEFSAECHGEGFGGYVEGGRTGSSLLNIGVMPPGRYLVPLLVVANGRPATIDLAIECSHF